MTPIDARPDMPIIDGEAFDPYAHIETPPPLRSLTETARFQSALVGESADVLASTIIMLGRFVAYPTEQAHIAHALWVLHTHLMDSWESTPRLAFLSPEPGSGKTRALEVTELLVPNPVEAVNVTPAYLFRKVGDDGKRPTILFDEIDTLFGPKARDNEEIRGVLNAGHRRGAVAGRCVVRGKSIETEEIPAYCAVALAGIGDLPDTLLSRSVVVRMRRRTARELIEPFRRRLHTPEGRELRSRIEAWADVVRPWIGTEYPTMPEGVTDRDADVWEPLLAVADAIDGDWSRLAREAAVAVVAETKRSTPSLGVRLLHDLRAAFGDRDAMSTASIIDALCASNEAPWGDLRGKPLTPRHLSRLLSKYNVQSKNIRVDGMVVKGYTHQDLHDAWQRYVALSSPAGSATSATPPERGVDAVASLREDQTDRLLSSGPSTTEMKGGTDDRSVAKRCEVSRSTKGR